MHVSGLAWEYCFIWSSADNFAEELIIVLVLPCVMLVRHTSTGEASELSCTMTTGVASGHG